MWSAMGVVIAVPELLAVAGGNNFLWPTISTTVGHLQYVARRAEPSVAATRGGRPGLSRHSSRSQSSLPQTEGIRFSRA